MSTQRSWVWRPRFRASAELLSGALAVGACFLCGCQGPAPIFPAVDPALVWPAPPDAPRIRYVGALSGEASLKGRPIGWAAVEALIAGPRRAVAFVQPTAVAVDGARVAVTDPGAPGGPALQVLDLEARTFVSLRAGFEQPVDVARVRDRWAVADARLGTVLMVDERGGPPKALAREWFERPVSLAWHEGANRLTILDAGLHACLVLDVETGQVVRSVGRRGAKEGNFNFPSGVASATLGGRERLLVADAMNFRVCVLGAEGEWLTSFGQKGNGAGDFSFPRDVAADSDGNVYVLDKHFENVQIFDADGRLLMAFGGGGSGPGQFSLPAGITIDGADRIWIADTGNRRVQVFQYMKEPS